MSLIAYTGVVSSIQIKPHNFVEIDLEIVSKALLHISLVREKFGYVNYHLDMTNKSLQTVWNQI